MEPNPLEELARNITRIAALMMRPEQTTDGLWHAWIPCEKPNFFRAEDRTHVVDMLRQFVEREFPDEKLRTIIEVTEWSN